MRSRPRRVLRTRPESCITRKCLVTAWRVTPVPAVSLLMEADPCSQRRTTRRKRISSPRAANSATELSNSVSAIGLRFLRNVFLDELEDHAPTLLVGGEGFDAARGRNLVEAGFGHSEHDAVGYFFQGEFDERRRLFGIIYSRLSGIGVPAEGEQSLGLDPVDGNFERDMLILLLSLSDLRID